MNRILRLSALTAGLLVPAFGGVGLQNSLGQGTPPATETEGSTDAGRALRATQQGGRPTIIVALTRSESGSKRLLAYLTATLGRSYQLAEVDVEEQASWIKQIGITGVPGFAVYGQTGGSMKLLGTKSGVADPATIVEWVTTLTAPLSATGPIDPNVNRASHQYPSGQTPSAQAPPMCPPTTAPPTTPAPPAIPVYAPPQTPVYSVPAPPPVMVSAPAPPIVFSPPQQTIVMAPQPPPNIVFAAPYPAPPTVSMAPTYAAPAPPQLLLPAPAPPPAPAPMYAAPAPMYAAPPMAAPPAYAAAPMYAAPAPAPAAAPVNLTAIVRPPSLFGRLVGTVGERMAEQNRPRYRLAQAATLAPAPVYAATAAPLYAPAPAVPVFAAPPVAAPPPVEAPPMPSPQGYPGCWACKGRGLFHHHGKN
jgi:hypothetical protein